MSSQQSSRRSSVRNSIASLGDLIKEHHRSLNAAHSTYYGGSSTSSPATSRSASTDSIQSVNAVELEKKSAHSSAQQSSSSSRLSGAWTAIKQRAVEHHQSVNAAYASYYGGGYSNTR